MNATVDRDDILALGAVSVLLQGYLREYEWEYGVIPRADDGKDKDADGWLLFLGDVKEAALEHARSDAMRPTREFNSNCSPEVCAEIFPLSCIFGAMRTRFTRIEPKLRALGGWTRGVPLHRLHQQGHPQEAAVRASGLSYHEVLEYAKRGEGDHPRVRQAAFEVLAEIRDEISEFQVAADALRREWERTGGKVAVAADPSSPAVVMAAALAGARWKDLSLRFTDGHTLKVTVRRDPKTTTAFGFAALGMKDGRNGNPNEQWDLLRTFAEHEGRLTRDHAEARDENKKRKQRLAAALRAAFGLEGDPFEPDGSGWRTRFDLHA